MFVPREEPKTEINTTTALWDFAENKHCGKNKKLTLSYKKEPRHIHVNITTTKIYAAFTWIQSIHGKPDYYYLFILSPFFADPRNGDELT